MIPAFVVSTIYRHHIITLLILVTSSEPIRFSWWHNGSSVERLVPLHTINDVLPRRCFQSFFSRSLQCSKRTGLPARVAGQQRRIIRPLVVISDQIKSVDRIWAGLMFLLEMGRAVCELGIIAGEFERSLVQGVATAACALGLPWGFGRAWPLLGVCCEGVFAVLSAGADCVRRGFL